MVLKYLVHVFVWVFTCRSLKQSQSFSVHRSELNASITKELPRQDDRQLASLIGVAEPPKGARNPGREGGRRLAPRRGAGRAVARAAPGRLRRGADRPPAVRPDLGSSWSKISKVFFSNSWRARSRLYRSRFLQVNMRCAAFFKFCKICIFLQRSRFNILAKSRFEKSTIFVQLYKFR